MSRTSASSSLSTTAHDNNNIILGHDNNPSNLRYDHILDDEQYERDYIFGELNDREQDSSENSVVENSDINNNNRGYMSYLWMEFKCKFKLSVLIIILIYYSYINKKQNDSNNWKSSRRVGYSEIGQCLNVGFDYIVEFKENYFKNENPSIFNPILVKLVNHESSGDYVEEFDCFTKQSKGYCENIFSNKEYNEYNIDIDILTNYIDTDDEYNYFKYKAEIVTFSFIAAIFSLIFEISSSGYITQRDGAFSTLSDKATLRKINILLTCIVSLLLFLSTSSFLLVYQYNCSQYYIGPNTLTPAGLTFCEYLLECGSTVSSVITPTEQGIRNYRNISSTLNLLLVFSSILRLTVKESDIYNARRHRGQVLPTTPIENFLIALNIEIDNNRITNIQQPVFRRIHDMLWLRRMTSNDTTSYERFLNQMDAINFRMNMIQQWKIKTIEEDELDPQSECPICLCDLFNYEVKNNNSNNKDNDDNNINKKNTNHKILDWSDPDILNNIGNNGITDINDFDNSKNNKSNNSVDNNKPNDNTIVIELPCKHCYHRSCLLEWTSSGKTTCPICRANLQSIS